MAYSGTVQNTVFSTRKVIESAIRRCRIPAAQITAEYVDIAKNELYLFLTSQANKGVPLWCIEKQIYPLYDGKGAVEMSAGTIDILNYNLRTLLATDGTDAQVADAITRDFTDATVISTIGLHWDDTPVAVSIFSSDDSIVWTELVVACQSAQATAAGQWSWFDLEVATEARYFRVEAVTGDLDIDQLVTSGQPSETPLYRMNRDDYTNLPNKTFTSERPTQFWFDAQIPNPFLRLWPVPNSAAEQSQITLYRQRKIMEVGTLSQQIEVPEAWYDAVVAGCAARCAREIVEVDPKLIPMLDSDAAIALKDAWAATRDNSPTYIAPNIAMYTR